MTKSLRLDDIDAPPGWSAHVETVLVEPAARDVVPLMIKAPAERPRANIIIRRSSTDLLDAQRALRTLLADQAQSIPGLKIESRGRVRFDDGAEGQTAVVQFMATAQLRAVQQHVVRVDDGVLTHFIATAEHARKHILDDLLRGAAKYAAAT